MHANDGWAVARFPNCSHREEFLRQVRLWNRLDDLPEIGAEVLNDGGVRLYGEGIWSRHLDRLVDAFGGRIENHAAAPIPA